MHNSSEKHVSTGGSNTLLGVRFVKHNDNKFNSLIGKTMAFDYWDIIEKCNLHYIDIGQNDKIYFYGNKEVDICFRFEEVWDDDRLLLELTDVYHYPEFYEKSKEEINNDLIRCKAIVLAITKEFESLTEKGYGINDNDFTDCQIDAYLQLKNEGRLK